MHWLVKFIIYHEIVCWQLYVLCTQWC